MLKNMKKVEEKNNVRLLQKTNTIIPKLLPQ